MVHGCASVGGDSRRNNVRSRDSVLVPRIPSRTANRCRHREESVAVHRLWSLLVVQRNALDGCYGARRLVKRNCASLKIDIEPIFSQELKLDLAFHNN